MGRRCSLKAFAVYRCVTWDSRLVGRLIIAMASNGHLIENLKKLFKGDTSINVTYFLTQIPQPMQRNSEMKAILSLDLTSIQSLPTEQ